jgi:hypothetical protein
MTTLRGAQLLHNISSNSDLRSVSVSGLLNFGDATSPGRGFWIDFATQDEDEIIAQSSTLSFLS